MIEDLPSLKFAEQHGWQKNWEKLVEVVTQVQRESGGSDMV
jgi:hypothetical protein